MLAVLSLALTGCAEPPPSAYYKSQTSAQGTPIGANTTGESCAMLTNAGGGADIFCGAWTQPSARIRPATETTDLMSLATTSPWRVELESRFACGQPKADAANTLVLQCTRRAGGWAQIALVTTAGNKVWLADGTPAAYPVIRRAIAQLSGGTEAASDAPISPDIANYLAARAFSAGDISQYETLMQAGLQANLAGRPDTAERAYRAALALQEKAQGPNSPSAAAAVMSLAVQLSDQGRFDDAKGFFDRATKLLQTPGAEEVDVNGQARLALYLGIDALNRSDAKAAIAYFRQSEVAYRRTAPDAPDSRAGGTGHRQPFGISAGRVALGDALGSSQAFATLSQREAVLGILEARRNLAVALRVSGDAAAAAQESHSADMFAQANGLTANLYAARLLRTDGITDAADNRVSDGVANLAGSVQAFRAAEPLSRPTAEAELALAALLDKQTKPADALAECRTAVGLLRDTKEAVDFERMQPCLDIYAAAAKGAGANEQPLLAEMFTASQLTRGSVTDQEIRRTAVRLAAGGSNPAVSAAIRQQQDAEKDLSDLLRQRDALGATPSDAAAAEKAADLDKQIAAARGKAADADSAVQSAAPNYQQLIQQATSSDDVFKVLRPNEAFVAITLAATEGWTFALRYHRISVARIDGGTPRIAALVKRVRGSIEPSETDNKVPRFDVAAAREIYDAVLAGVAPALSNAELLSVAPTGPLLSLPFEVLLTGPADAEDLGKAPFLVRQFTIAHIPAAANFVKLRQVAPSKAPKAWIGFGNFNPITPAQATATYPGERCRTSAAELAGLPALEGTKQELGLVAKVFKADPSDEITGGAFTVKSVEAAPLANYRIVHFATHALLPAEIACQDEPAIITSAPAGAANANGALLTAADVAGLKLDADAVILSACNSGGPGGTTAGESLAGLARSFFYAGARSLMVTHWTVEDEFATYLIGLSLGTLQQNPSMGLAAALRTAQLKLLDRTDMAANLKHPYYWAPFALVGEGGGGAAEKLKVSVSLK